MKFTGDNFEFTVSDFEVLRVTDNCNGNCCVLVRLTGDNVQCVHEFTDFEYKNDSWETEDILKFIENKLS